MKFVRSLFRFFYGCLVVATLMSYAAPWIDPADWPRLSLFGLFYPYLYLLHGVALLWLVVQRSNLRWSGAVILLLGLPFLFRIVNFSFPPEGTTNLRVLSFNAHHLSYSATPAENAATLYQLFSETDLLCFQELSRKSARQLTARFEGYYFKRADRSTQAILTRYPMLRTGELQLGETLNGILWADLRHPSGTIRVYNVHLESNRVAPRIERLHERRTLGDRHAWRDVRGVLGRVARQVQQRVRQTDLLLEHLARSPHPVLLMGDLNDTPTSFVYRRLTQSLHDGFLHRGAGSGATYAGRVPLLRIDYILADDRFRFCSYATDRRLASDHYPVAARLYFSAN